MAKRKSVSGTKLPPKKPVTENWFGDIIEYSDTKLPPKKTVTAMYPKPERVTYRSDGPDVDIDAVVRVMVTIEDRRMELTGRLEAATKALREIVLPHYGERPGDFTPEQWADIDYRERRLWELPGTPPSEARDAFDGLRAIHRIRCEMRALRGDPAAANRSKIGGQPDAAIRMACWAIDLGLLLQRCDAQVEFGELVAVGKGSNDARATGSEATRAIAADKSEFARVEYERRRSSWRHNREKTSTLINMADMTNDDGTFVYGSLTTLKRYSKDWK